jgi:hypothetical protein
MGVLLPVFVTKQFAEADAGRAKRLIAAAIERRSSPPLTAKT